MKGWTQISREARRAMLALGLILFLVLALLLGRSVATIGTDRILPASGHDYGEIAQLGDETMLLEAGSTGSEIHKWAMTGKGVHTFGLDEAIFQPGTAAISPDGKVRLGRFVKLVDAYPRIGANIFIAGNEGASAEQLSLLQGRAEQVRNELVAEGVVARVEAAPAQLRAAKGPSVYIGLSHRG